MKPFFLKADGNNQPTSTPIPSDYVEVIVLVANVNQAVAVPAAAADGFVIFAAEGPFWAKPNGAAAIPAASTVNGAGSTLNPASWCLEGVTSINIIAPDAIKLSLSFYKAKP